MSVRKVIVIVVSLILLLCSGCKTRLVEVEKPVIVEHTSTQHHTDIVRDTLIQRDSVYHYVMGDTTIIERWHYTTQVNQQVVADTVRDSIPVVTTVTERVEVERQLTRWQRVKMDAGGIALGAVGLALIFFIIKLILRIRGISK